MTLNSVKASAQQQQAVTLRVPYLSCSFVAGTSILVIPVTLIGVLGRVQHRRSTRDHPMITPWAIKEVSVSGKGLPFTYPLDKKKKKNCQPLLKY